VWGMNIIATTFLSLFLTWLCLRRPGRS